MIPRNAADVKAPRPTPKEMRPFYEEVARLFLGATRGDPFEALHALALTTGLRRGELLGVRWDDVDVERGTLRVGRALLREGGRHAVVETKTRRGRRQVNLTPRTVKALRTHRKRHGRCARVASGRVPPTLHTRNVIGEQNVESRGFFGNSVDRADIFCELRKRSILRGRTSPLRLSKKFGTKIP